MSVAEYKRNQVCLCGKIHFKKRNLNQVNKHKFVILNLITFMFFNFCRMSFGLLVFWSFGVYFGVYFLCSQLLLSLARSIFEETSSLDRLINKIMIKAQELLQCEKCRVYLVDTERQEVEV